MLSDEDMEGGFEDLEAEDGMDGGFVDLEAEEDAEEPADSPPKVQAPPAGSSHYSLPSNEEIHGLKETGDLYLNNVFKLQLDEMLQHVRPRMDRAKSLEQTLRKLQALFEALPDIDMQPLSAATETLERIVGHAVEVPWADPVPRGDPAYSIGFAKPSALHLIGSWPLKAAARRPGAMDVDMEVCMPSSLFQEKDTMNARYFTKRAFYLAVLAESLRQAESSLRLDVDYLDLYGDRRCTYLVLRPQPDAHEWASLHAVIRVHVAHASGTFPVQRLAPDRNSLRGALVGATEGAELPATPLYNACILADSMRLAHFVYLNATAEMCAAFAEACQLLKTWATQRGFGSLLLFGHDAKKHAARRVVAGTDDARFVLSMLLAHLLHGEPKGSATRHKLAPGLSSVQLFRGTLDYLSKQSFATPVFMKAQPRFGLAPSTIPATAMAASERAFVDPSGSLNLLAHWPASSVDLLQREAAQTMRMLNDSDDHFATLFLTPQSILAQRFDEVVLCHVRDDMADVVRRLDAGGARAWGIRRALDVAARALGQRAQGLAVCAAPSQAYAPGAAPALSLHLELGLLLDADHAWHQVEHGPPPESPEAAQFRAFWGDAAELRRFRDGRVLESVVWPVASLAQRYGLPRHVLRHAFMHHRIAKKVRCMGEGFAGLVDMTPSLSSRAYLKDPAVHGFQLVQAAYDQLVRELRAMDELPLSVMGVAPVAPALRSMSPLVPGPLHLAELGGQVPDVAAYLPLQALLLTMESSGQWPDDLAAIQEMKTALYERMADVLMKRLPGSLARVVYDNDATTGETIQDQTALHLTLATGFAFSLRIHHDREQTLLERLLRDKSTRAVAAHALQRYHMRFTYAPAHHAALQALQDRHPALGMTVRLVRRWFAAQLLSPHVPVEAMELLAVAVFVTNAHAAPVTGVHGLVRVLHLLAHWDWRETPLLIPLENATRLAHQRKAALSDEGSTLLKEAAPSFPAAQRADAEQQFSAQRARDPALKHHAWVLATEMDIGSKAWTRDAPSAMVADGVRQLALRAVRMLEEVPTRLAHIRALFAPAFDAYDFVIHIRPSVHMRYAEALAPDAGAWLQPRKKRSYANLEDAPLRPSVYGSEPRAGLDPVAEYVQLLQQLYPDTFTLFYDELGGTAIGGLWNRALGKPHAFKVLLGHSSAPHAKGVVLNRAAILAEVQRLGHGLVDRVDVL